MSKQRIIKDEIWDDEWFYDLDPSEKLVWLFLLTNPRNNIAGIYKVNVRWISNLVGFDKDVTNNILKRFVNDEKIVFEDGWVALVNFYKHLPYRNPSVTTGIKRIGDTLTGCPQSVYTVYLTLLNSTLLNLSEGETNVSPLLNLKTKKNNKDMGWNNTADDFEEGVVNYETGELEEEKKPQTKKYPNAPAIRKIFQEILGVNPQSWKQHKPQLESCENLFQERTPEKVRSALIFYKENKDKEFCPSINSPYDLDAKWTKLGEFKLKQL